MAEIAAGKITGTIFGLGFLALAVKKIKGKLNERKKERNAFLHGKEVENDDGSFWRHKGPLAGDINNARKYAGSV